MKVNVALSDETFWKIAAVAEQFEMRVDEYLVELADMTAAKARTVDTDPVAVMWRKGATDREIAAALGMTNAKVSRRRLGHGFPANKRSTNKEASK